MKPSNYQLINVVMATTSIFNFVPKYCILKVTTKFLGLYVRELKNHVEVLDDVVC